MKKGSKLLFMFAIMFVFGAVNVNAASLPTAVDGKITLNENITLDGKHLINQGETLTIDLAGFTLTGANADYTIDNRGTLILIDSGSEKGKIECPAESASCLRNFGGNMTINGITINSAFVAVKNEEESTLLITDSRLKSTFITPSNRVTGVVVNAGTATINTSVIDGGSGTHGIYATSGATAELKNSITNINNSELIGSSSLYSRRDDNSISDVTTQTININGGKFTTKVSATSLRGSNVNITGDVQTTALSVSTILELADNGANVILGENYKKSLKVPAGVNLTIADGVTYTITGSNKLTLLGSLDVKGTLDAGTYVKETNTYYGTLANAIKLIGEGKTIVVLKDDKSTGLIQAYKNKDVTIDLNGYSVSANIGNYAESKLTIQDSSEKQTGIVTGTVTNNGIMNIEGGKFTNTLVSEEGATTNLNGGTYSLDNITNTNIPENMEIKDNGDQTYSVVYKDADYSAVDKALETASTIDKTKYTDESVKILEDAINAVVRNKKINEQTAVDTMAININNAIAGLVQIVENPETGDNIVIYFCLATISFIGLLGSAFKLSMNGN